MSGPRFITFEGLDGAGKSTHFESLAARLRRGGPAPPARPIARPLSPLPSGGLGEEARLVVRGAAL